MAANTDSDSSAAPKIRRNSGARTGRPSVQASPMEVGSAADSDGSIRAISAISVVQKNRWGSQLRIGAEDGRDGERKVPAEQRGGDAFEPAPCS